jgi:hypothetical protein
MQTNKEKNELIARFLEFTQKSYVKNPEEKDLLWCDNKHGLPVGELKFDQSWDWLMPVLDKIEALGYDTSICTMKGEQLVQMWRKTNWKKATDLIIDDDFGGRTKFETTYDSVVSFIEWYNENELNNGNETKI